MKQLHDDNFAAHLAKRRPAPPPATEAAIQAAPVAEHKERIEQKEQTWNLAETVWTVIKAVHQREINGSQGRRQTPEIKKIIARHLHTIQEITGGVLELGHTHKWHSNLAGAKLAGSTGGGLVDFMKDTYTSN